VSGNVPSDYNSFMNARRLIRICATLLGFWVALTPAIAAAPAAGMAYHAGMSDDRAAGGPGPCPDTDMDRKICAFICLGASPLIVPSETVGLFAAVFDARHWVGKSPSLSGRHFTPDPAPPRSRSLP
jgi:hypothetical protein